MSEWLALLIPGVLAIILLKFFRKEVTVWELLIPAAASAIFILVFKFSVKTVMTNDTEYWGDQIVSARYYEYWATWVTQTCTRTYECNCSTDSKGQTTCQTCTEYYDCSYCDENSAYWVAVDEYGNEHKIDQDYYNYLTKKWHATPQFVDMNRSIDFSHGCGKDGDAYDIKWDGRQETSETHVTEHNYTNKIQASHSSFKLPHIGKERAQNLGLYDYPEYYDFYKQRAVLGLEKMYTGDSLDYYETLFQYINGYYGPRNKIKLFVCLFYNQPIERAFQQEAYWDGGNQNELVVCIGVDKATHNLQWVKPFSFTNDKRLLVDVREDIMELGSFKPAAIQKAIADNIHGDVHRSFKKDFDYLDIELPNWALWVLWIGTLIISVGASIWTIGNEYVNEDDSSEIPARTTSYGYSYYKQSETFGERFSRRFNKFATRFKANAQVAWDELVKKFKK